MLIPSKEVNSSNIPYCSVQLNVLLKGTLMYQHRYSLALFICFGWCELQTMKWEDSCSINGVVQLRASPSWPQSDFLGLAAAGSAPLRLWRAGPASVASVE